VRVLEIDVIFDPSCPWCYIGKRQLERAISLRPNASVRRHWWPFLLNPDMPNGGVDRTRYLIRKFGSEARVSRIFRAIAHVGQSVEIKFAFERIGRAPNTLNAHRLVRFAEDVGQADGAVEALFHEHFVKGRDIGNLEVLIEIGRTLEIDERHLRRHLTSDADVATIYEQNARAHRLGINGVPAFVFAGRFVICGAQEPRTLARMIDIGRETVGSGFTQNLGYVGHGAW
jgi:predicted DsbA family dithiol-disulfide isomerase